MSAVGSIAKTKAGQYVIIGAVALVVGYLAYKFVISELGKLQKGTSNVAKGNTNLLGDDISDDAYKGKGVVGSVADTANTLSGGSLSDIGSAIGGWLYDVTHKDPMGQTKPKELVGSANTLSQSWGDNFFDRGVLQ